MKLRRLGKIFNPLDHDLGRNYAGYAQSPQALVFSDFIRVYFSTRSVDQCGKFLSHVAYVDFENDMKTVRSVSKHEVIKLGFLGCFDEHGIFPFHAVRNGNRILAYTCGWSRRVSVSVETGIGLAESFDDGVTFEKYGTGPIMTSSCNEPFLVGDAFVMSAYAKWHMWYIFGTHWSNDGRGQAERTYKIGHATSIDGVTWEKKKGPVVLPDVLGEFECQALPTVVRLGKQFHMFFCFRQSFGFRDDPTRGYRLGHATSNDLETWERTQPELQITGDAEEWDSKMQCYPNAFTHNGRAFLLYNGNAFGKLGFGIAEILL
jgi:hypothetical protein